MPRPLFRFFFVGFLDIDTVHLFTKSQVASSTRIEDKILCTPKYLGARDLGHARFLDFSLRIFEILPLCIYVPNFKSLSVLAFEIL